jgi:anti-sigma factor RsiW
MKPENPAPQDEALSKALRQWRLDAPLPPQFQEQVWRRIERAETRVPAWLLLFRQFNAALMRPSLAVGYVVLLLLVGSVAGYHHAQTVNAQAEQLLSQRYVQMLDPYRMPHH